MYSDWIAHIAILVAVGHKTHPSYRRGQAAFNFVAQVCGDEFARSISVDPFYRDELTEQFLDEVYSKLSELEARHKGDLT